MVYFWIGQEYSAGEFSLNKQYISTGGVTAPKHEPKYPNTSDIRFLSLTTCSIPEDMDRIKLQDKSTNKKDKDLKLEMIKNDNLIDI